MKVIVKYLFGLVALMISYNAFAYDGQIAGEYHGWDGETIYRLMDGHVIQQAVYYYHYYYLYSPVVHIFQRGGQYVIIIDGDEDNPVPITILR